MKQRIEIIVCLVVLGSNAVAWAQPEETSEAPQEGESEPPAEGEGAAPEPEEPAPAADATPVAVEAEPPPRPPAFDDDIIITGTRIRGRTSFGASAPVEVIGREQLRQSGAKNLPDVIQYLTATQGSGVQGAAVVGPGGSAAASFNLRGLGPGATLLLLNGRRLNPAGGALGGAHFADIATIPLAAVERLEILKAGAAAIYGADAIGGVINVITRKKWNGARAQVDGQSTSRFDHGEYTMSGGFGSIGEDSRILAAVSYFRRTQLLVTKRDFPRGPSNPDGSGGKYWSAPLWPAGYFDIAMPAAPIMLDPACAAIPGLCTNFYGDSIPLFPNGERGNGFASAEYDLTKHLTVFGEFGVSRYRGDNIILPAYGLLSPVYLNPPRIVVPADHIDNPFPNSPAVRIQGAPLGVGSPPQMQVAADDNIRVLLGLKGDFEGVGKDTLFESWQWELSASLGSSRYRESIADVLVDAFQDALNSCSDPTDLDRCFNPFYSNLDGTGTPNTQVVIDSFFGRQTVQADHALNVYNAGLTGTLFELPGGELGFALGGEMRREWRVTELDHDANQLKFGFLVGNTNGTALREVYSGYLELRWPFLEGVELQTAGRLEHYVDTQSTAFSPFAGLVLTPSQMIGRDSTPGALRRLQLRFNASRAFRAPTIFNTYPGYGTLPSVLSFKGIPRFTTVRTYGNPNLEPETALTFSGGLQWSPVDEISLTADYWYYDYTNRIQTENAQAVVTASEMVPDPDRVKLSDPNTLNWVEIKYINVPGSTITQGLDFGLVLRLNGTTFGGSRDSFGEFSLSAQGTYTLAFDAPRSQSGARPVNCDGMRPQDKCHLVGLRNAGNDAPPLPEWRVNIPLTWSYGTHSFGVIGHYISGFLDDFAAVVPNPMTPLVFYYDPAVRLPAWFSFDLQYSYSLRDVIGKDLTLRVGCQNVLDKMPPLARGTASFFTGEVHDPRGRMVYASLSAEL